MDESVSWETGWSLTLETKKKYVGTGVVYEMEERKDSEISFGCLKFNLS